uniref:TIR domain-containing protein n=1 Tax=Candidatus Cryptobacteroides bacterium TaxID=3085639 RepID=UPI004027DA04
MIAYRTKTYVAGEWSGDSDAIEQLYKWNEGDRWRFHFNDAHAYKQCYDTSKPCTIKDSLRDRMSHSKVFVLIVGNDTAIVRKGSCAYQDCANKQFDFSSGHYYCTAICKTYSTQSFIDYECQMAYCAYLRSVMRIVVLYNAVSVDKTKCPEVLRNIGIHLPMKCWKNGVWGRYKDWDYGTVKNAIG